MKTLGLIGGTSWVSSLDYYRLINQGINNRLGGVNGAKLILHSFNYQEIADNNVNNNWPANEKMVVEAALNLKRSGAEAFVLCANTMHLSAEVVAAETGLPVIHIATATAFAIKASGIHKVALLGTKYTMEKNFFRDKLTEAGIESLIPEEADREEINRTLAEELGKGLMLPETKAFYLGVMEKMRAQGAEGIILGCTEIPLLIKAADMDIPMFDTTEIHAAAAVSFALA